MTRHSDHLGQLAGLRRSAWEPYRFLFLGGLHRSGTSILFQCLREHPQISGFRDSQAPEDEGQFLQTVYPPAHAYGGPGLFGFSPETHLTEVSSLISDDNRCRLFAEWRPFWDLSRPVLMEKSPPNLVRTRFLQACFPNSYFVIVVRHPIAVSYATQAWRKRGAPDLLRLLEHWLVCHETLESDQTWVRNLLLIRYEDFVAAPQITLDRVYAFIGLAPRPKHVKIHPFENEKYLNMWRECRSNEGHSGSAQAVTAIQRYEQRVRQFGYSLLE